MLLTNVHGCYLISQWMILIKISLKYLKYLPYSGFSFTPRGRRFHLTVSGLINRRKIIELQLARISYVLHLAIGMGSITWCSHGGVMPRHNVWDIKTHFKEANFKWDLLKWEKCLHLSVQLDYSYIKPVTTCVENLNVCSLKCLNDISIVPCP